MTNDEKLAHALKLKFGLAPAEPTRLQLTAIKNAILKIFAANRRPSESDWATVVLQCCPGAGRHRYAGADNSDLNALLVLALQSAQGK